MPQSLGRFNGLVNFRTQRKRQLGSKVLESPELPSHLDFGVFKLAGRLFVRFLILLSILDAFVQECLVLLQSGLDILELVCVECLIDLVQEQSSLLNGLLDLFGKVRLFLRRKGLLCRPQKQHQNRTRNHRGEATST